MTYANIVAVKVDFEQEKGRNMRLLSANFKFFALAILLSWMNFVSADNQTPDLSPILPGSDLPFRIRIQLVHDKEHNAFLLPNGLQSFVYGVHDGQWLLLEGRTNGMHGFNEDPNNFPSQTQNHTLYVVDPKRKTVLSRSLIDLQSGLSQDQIDSLSATATQFYQKGDTLYITGGYGFKNSINNYTTFDVLTAIDVPGLIHWVKHPEKNTPATQYIRQISNPVFKITGGDMHQLNKDGPTLLTFGQNFEGAYFMPGSTQVYSRQVRRFNIMDDGSELGVEVLAATPLNENFRRRDLNIIPVILRHSHGKLHYGLMALSGVFTETGGAWTVPVTVTDNGIPFMADPTLYFTFKQGMNNYSCAFLSLYSKKTGDTYFILPGGITYEYFEDGTLKQEEELPFTNQVTTIKRDKHGFFTQYIMDSEYPVILSTRSNPGNRLLFGASAEFIPANGLEKLQYPYAIFKFDRIKKPLVLGYIVGGIQSTLANTNSMSDSAASPYIFKVILEPSS